MARGHGLDPGAYGAHVLRQSQDNLATARCLTAGEWAFPQRVVQTLLVGRFLADYWA
ncbi:hypothetical protein [Streptomyces sp. NPDC059176]|uniref:hypothetical protein n=1 Tax=Streptomyces sp. NPDC059176 TaxID=3346758 RepID=UPI0036753D09